MGQQVNLYAVGLDHGPSKVILCLMERSKDGTTSKLINVS